MIKQFYYLLGVVMLLSTSSCRMLYPNEMFKQKDYQFFELAKKKIDEYVIEPSDELTLEVYSRDGFKLVDVLGGNVTVISMNGSQGGGGTSSNESGKVRYLVDKEGFAKFPVLGQMYVKGYTQNELETQISQRYASLFVNPFVVLKVVNRRVFIFRGEQGSVVNLNDAPTSLIEVLAKAGGLTRQMKSYNIKLIRGDLKNPQVRIIDLSSLEGLRQADLIVQSNDIIYINQRKRVLTDALADIAPIFSLLSVLITTITLAKLFSK